MIWLRTLGLAENALDGATTAATGHLHMHEETGRQNTVRLGSGSGKLYGTDLDVELVGLFSVGHC